MLLIFMFYCFDWTWARVASDRFLNAFCKELGLVTKKRFGTKSLFHPWFKRSSFLLNWCFHSEKLHFFRKLRLVLLSPLQKMLRPIYEIKQRSTFMERLIADYVQFSCAIAKFLFLEQRLDTRLCLCCV